MRYYFSKLDKEGREIYKKLYFGMQNFEKKISLKGTENIVREIYYMIIKDNPMMFFVHPSKLTYFKIVHSFPTRRSSDHRKSVV